MLRVRIAALLAAHYSPVRIKVKKNGGSIHQGGKMLLRFAFTLTFLGGIVLALLFTGCNRHGRTEAMAGKPMIAGRIVYVALGDSTGFGGGAKDGGYVKRLFNRINERRPGSTLNNLCVSGATTADLIRVQLNRAVELNP